LGIKWHMRSPLVMAADIHGVTVDDLCLK
jgi:hypothetical protein